MRVEVAYNSHRGEWTATPKRGIGQASYHDTKAEAVNVGKQMARDRRCKCEIYNKHGKFHREYDPTGDDTGHAFDPDDIDIPGL